MTATLPKALVDEARKLAVESGRDAQDVLEELLEESIRMGRVPGIVFADGATGRRARIAGTGIEVFEAIDDYRESARSWDAIQRAFDWLTEAQLSAAVDYYEAYPAAIDTRLDVDEVATFEALWEKHPITRPPPVIRFYLNEDLSPEIARIGRTLGIDITSAQDVGRKGLPDPEQLDHPAAEGRCLVTRNRASATLER